MAPDDPRHGTYAGAIAHWKSGETTADCDPCRRAATRRRTQTDLRALAGAGPARGPLGEDAYRILVNLTPKQLSDLTGIRQQTLTRYRRGGPTIGVHHRTRDKILAARPAWTVVGITRRVQALHTLGYTLAELAVECGTSRETLGHLRGLRSTRAQSPERLFVRTSVAEGILAAYDRLQLTPQPVDRFHTRTRNLAREHKWAPPLAWDDIDDPDERPHGTAGRPRRGRAKGELIAEWEHLREGGLTERQALAALDVQRETLLTAYRRSGTSPRWTTVEDQGRAA